VTSGEKNPCEKKSPFSPYIFRPPQALPFHRFSQGDPILLSYWTGDSPNGSGGSSSSSSSSKGRGGAGGRKGGKGGTSNNDPAGMYDNELGSESEALGLLRLDGTVSDCSKSQIRIALDDQAVENLRNAAGLLGREVVARPFWRLDKALSVRFLFFFPFLFLSFFLSPFHCITTPCS
jgi:hypothetical protein